MRRGEPFIQRVIVTCLCAVMIFGVAGCGEEQERESAVSPAPVTEPTATAAATSFTAEGWASPEGRTLAAAQDLIGRGLLDGMSLPEVWEFLGREDSSAIPVDYEVAAGSGSAGIGYTLATGASLDLTFEDGIFDEAEIHGRTSDAELELVGIWDVAGGLRLKSVEFNGGGGLIRQLERESDGRVIRGYGHWWVPEPGKVVFYNVRIDEDTDISSAYEYSVSGDELTLRWIDEAFASPLWEERQAVAGEWIAGESQPEMRLVRQ